MNKQKLAFLNRQPSLWSHSAPVVELIPSDEDDDVIGVNPLTLEPMNSDFDGDTNALYILHSEEALNEMYEKAFIQNRVYYEQNKNFLAIVRHEALYAAFILTDNLENINEEIILEITNLKDLPESINFYNENLYKTVKVNNFLTTYGNALLNKWCGFNKIVLNETITKKNANEISRQIYKYNNRTSKIFYDKLSELEKLLFTFVSITKYAPSLNLSEMIDLVDEETESLFKKIPDNNVYLGYHINEGLIERSLLKFDKNSSLYKLFKSGSRFSKTQLARSCINIGYTSDDKNIIIKKPIKSNLLKGLTEEDFFAGSPGSRKGIADKSKYTPQSGYLERTIVMALSVLEIVEEDCYTDKSLEIIVFSKDHAKTLDGKYFKDPSNPEMEWELLDYVKAKNYINKKIYIRSPITCQTPNLRICKKCFGERKFPTKYVGITAGTNLTERLTQLIMRSFHTSGSAELTVAKSVKEFFQLYLSDIIILENDDIKLKVLNTEIPEAMTQIPGFKYSKDYEIVFSPFNEEVSNKDTVALLNSVKDLLKTDREVNIHPQDYYNQLMSSLLTIGVIYSSFVEMMFANSFLVDIENKRFWRYNQDQQILMKLGDKSISKYISSLLGLLYEPNKQSISLIEDDFKTIEFDSNIHTIYEKIWLNEL